MDLIGNKFYQNLGKLFFAVAACDKVVREEEFTSLKKTVTNHWMEVDKTEDEFGNDAAYQIEIVFDFLHASAFEDHAADFVEDFASFKKENEELFPPKVERIIWRTCVAIADAFYGRNSLEKEILARIKKLLLG
jgi:hypothetical protein